MYISKKDLDILKYRLYKIFKKMYSEGVVGDFVVVLNRGMVTIKKSRELDGEDIVILKIGYTESNKNKGYVDKLSKISAFTVLHRIITFVD